MGTKIEDLQGNIFEIKENRDLIKRIPVHFDEEFIYTRDLITDRIFILVKLPNNQYDAIINLGKAFNYLYLRVSLELVDTKESNDIRKAHLYGKKNTKTIGNNQHDGRISSTKGSKTPK